ncbi:MAG: mitochondrial fission ELM1 family protein [Candidatus Omnitrophica bacterium]|nr:mitochondrial fission ELM1 family protein [Candidatus Omnitrophota bacterium]
MGKLNSIQSSIAVGILKIFSAFVQMIPIRVALFIGRRLGDLAYWASIKSRRTVMLNLRIAFSAEKTAAELRKIARDFYRAYGMNFVEVGRLPLIARQGYGKMVVVEGREHLDAAMSRGKGAIFLSMHSGNWELSNLVGSMSGYRYNMVANDLQHINKVADFLDDLRKSAGCRIINPGIGGREIIRCLKNNEIVTLVADQGGRDGVLVPFFGHEASMSTGAVRLAIKYDVPILLVNIHRIKGARHHLRALPFHVATTGNMENDLHENLSRMASQYEAWIRECPQEYIWMYKTWKYSKVRHIALLDDARTGHLRQAESVVRNASRIYEECGLMVNIRTIPVRYKSRFHAAVLNILTAGKFFGSGGIQMIAFFVTKETFEALSVMKPDLVVSAGARNAAVNLRFARVNRAKSVALLRPGLSSRQNFDCVILPQHDCQGEVPGENLVVTKAAPNLVDKKYLDDHSKALMNRYSHLKGGIRTRVGVLIGGDTKGLRLTEQQVKVVVHQLVAAANELGVELLVTTSRRTSAAVEDMLLAELRDHPRCALLILANRNNVPEAVGGILGLSDVVVVSGESISMVSEAASAGKKIVVFPVDGEDSAASKKKYADFMDGLAQEGYIIVARTTGIAAALDSLFRNKMTTKPIDDNALITAALRKFLK